MNTKELLTTLSDAVTAFGKTLNVAIVEEVGDDCEIKFVVMSSIECRGKNYSQRLKNSCIDLSIRPFLFIFVERKTI